MSTDVNSGKAVTSPKRLTALGGAALVTLLTCAGALGIGPGALGQQSAAASPSASSVAHGSSAARQPGSSSTAPHASGDNWVTVQDSPTRTPGDKGNASSGPGADPPAHAVPRHSGHGRRIVYDISEQRVWLVNRRGEVERTYLVSGSKNESLVKPGKYDVYSMSRHAVSYNGKETMNYMVRFTSGKRSAIGFHDIPALPDGTLAESRSQLGTPQSAGCIRQWITDAQALWEFATVGTRVIVTA